MSSWSTSAGRRPTFTPPSRLSLHLSGFARPACRRSPSGAPWRAISACAGAPPAFWTRTETGSRRRAELAGNTPEQLGHACARRQRQPDYLPDGPDEDRIDRALATACVAHALRRHCGILSTVYLPGQGTDFVQRGADLRDVPLVIGTGGVLGRHAAMAKPCFAPRSNAGRRAR